MIPVVWRVGGRGRQRYLSTSTEGGGAKGRSGFEKNFTELRIEEVGFLPCVFLPMCSCVLVENI